MHAQFSRRSMITILGSTAFGGAVARGHDLRPDDPTYRYHDYENIVNRNAQIKQVY